MHLTTNRRKEGEQRNLDVAKKKENQKMQHYCCPQTWYAAAEKCNNVFYVKKERQNFIKCKWDIHLLRDSKMWGWKHPEECRGDEERNQL